MVNKIKIFGCTISKAAIIFLLTQFLLSNSKAQKSSSYKTIYDSIISTYPQFRNYATLSICDKVELLDSVAHQCGLTICNNISISFIISDIAKITNIPSKRENSSSLFLQSYESIFDFNKDVVEWRNALQCSGFRKYYFDKVLEDSLSFYNEKTNLTSRDLLHRGYIYYKFNELERSYNDFILAYKSDTNNLSALNAIGIMQVNYKRNPHEGIATYSKCIKKQKTFYKAYYNRACAKIIIGDTLGGLTDLNKAISLNGKDSYSLYERGYINFWKGQYELALPDFSKAIKYASSFQENIHYYRGLTYIKLNMIKNACEDFQIAKKRSMELDPVFRRHNRPDGDILDLIDDYCR